MDSGSWSRLDHDWKGRREDGDFDSSSMLFTVIDLKDALSSDELTLLNFTRGFFPLYPPLNFSPPLGVVLLILLT